MSAGGLLKGLMEGDVRGAFALIDASTLDVRPGVIASAVGKAVRVHELPRGAMVVGLSCPAKNELRDLVTRADDIRKAGGGIALMLDGTGAKPLKGFDPDMVWLSALDVPLGRRSRKTQLDAVHKRFGVPIVMRDLQSAEEEDTARAEGALFGVGSAFSDVDLPRPAAADAQGFDQPGGAMSALRAKGLR